MQSGNIIYIFGSFINSNYSGCSYKYDISQNTLTSINSLDEYVGRRGIATDGTYIYLFGVDSNLYRYNTQTNTYQTLLSFGTSLSVNSVGRIINNELYVFDGNKVFCCNLSNNTVTNYGNILDTYSIKDVTRYKNFLYLLSSNGDILIFSPDSLKMRNTDRMFIVLNKQDCIGSISNTINFVNRVLKYNASNQQDNCQKYVSDGNSWIEI